MSVKTRQIPAMTIVGLNIRTKPMAPEIPALWPRFVARIAEIDDPAEPGVAYGVMRPLPDALQYMAGIAVSKPGRIPAGMESVSIPGGTYAVFSYPISQLGKGFCEIYEKLLPAAGLRVAPGPSLEHYGPDFKAHDAHAPVGIWIPVSR
jgi:predicted transcriptional regulator YdeE